MQDFTGQFESCGSLACRPDGGGERVAALRRGGIPRRDGVQHESRQAVAASPQSAHERARRQVDQRGPEEASSALNQ